MGNNLFQYFATKYGFSEDGCYVGVLNKPSFNRTRPNLFQRLLARLMRVFAKQLNDNSFFLSSQKLKFLNVFDGYGEYLELFEGKEDVLRADFLTNVSKLPRPATLGNSSLNIVIHLRLGDRLLRKSDYQPGMQYDLEKLDQLLAEIKMCHGEFKLLIATDFKDVMSPVSKSEFDAMNFHVEVEKSERVEYPIASKYLADIAKFIERNNGHILKSQTIEEDFAHMYHSDILIFGHGTLAWWAGFIGEQKEVYVSKFWRPAKKTNNKNLQLVNNPRWRKW